MASTLVTSGEKWEMGTKKTTEEDRELTSSWHVWSSNKEDKTDTERLNSSVRLRTHLISFNYPVNGTEYNFHEVNKTIGKKKVGTK